MIKEDCTLLNKIIEEMHFLTERLDESLKKQDFQKVTLIKKQLAALQERVNKIL